MGKAARCRLPACETADCQSALQPFRDLHIDLKVKQPPLPPKV
jgi:hypothetical protein